MSKDYIELCEFIRRNAVTSLLYEVSATPKPGLVDRFNQGSHNDMDFFSFMASSSALSPYFYKCALKGAEFQGNNPEKLFESLRPAGLDAERAMFMATGGVNTHKGLIFSLGIVCAASAVFYKNNRRSGMQDIEEICNIVSQMTQGICQRELVSIKKKDDLTNGEKVYRKYGVKGIRGEVENGFPTVRNFSLPVLTDLMHMNKHTMNDIFVQTLLHIMSVNDDSNVLARQDLDTLGYVKEYASKALRAGGMFTSEGKDIVYRMDRDFIRNNISPGGSADLLAVTIMFYLVSN